ncbi:MAG: ABC transporter permease, partial [Pseudomonadota bacterium]
MTAATLRPVLDALLSHWRRNPVQLAALLVGLAVATALWSGVQALNAEARASYDRAAGQIGGSVARLVPAVGETIDQADWAALRRAGHDVSPVLEGRLEVEGDSVVLLGIEPLSLPAGANIDIAAAEGGGDGNGFADFVLPPHQTLASRTTLRDLGLAPGDVARTAEGERLPAAAIRPNLLDGVLVVDIGVAQRLLGRQGRLSYLLLGDRAAPGAVEAVTGGRLERVDPETP